MRVVQLMLQHRRRRRMIARHRAGWLVLRYHRRVGWMRVNPVRVHWTRRLRSLAQLLLKHRRAHRLLDHGTTRHRRTRRLSVSLLNLLMKLGARRVGGLGDHRRTRWFLHRMLLLRLLLLLLLLLHLQELLPLLLRYLLLLLLL